MNIRMMSVLRPCQTDSNASKPEAKQKTRNNEGKSTPRVDTFESSASKVFGGSMRSDSDGRLRLESPVLPSGTLEYFDPNERDGIDWETLEKDYFGNQRQMSSSYERTVGGFYETMGNKGAASAMAAKAAAIMNFPGLSGTNGRFI